MPDALKDQVFEHLARLAAVANLSEENRIAYDKALDRYRVSEIVEDDIRQDKAKEIARQMKQDGVSSEKIAKYTGLSLEIINSLI